GKTCRTDTSDFIVDSSELDMARETPTGGVGARKPVSGAASSQSFGRQRYPARHGACCISSLGSGPEISEDGGGYHHSALGAPSNSSMSRLRTGPTAPSGKAPGWKKRCSAIS